MRAKRRIKRIRALALAVALVMVFLSPGTAYALDEAGKAQLSAAALLAEQDLSANLESIRVLINTCIDGLAADDPARTALQSVLTLLDSENANAEAVALLLRTAADSGGQTQQTAPTQSVPGTGPTAAPGAEMSAEPSPEGTGGDTAAALPTQMPAEAAGVDETLEPSALGLPVFEVSAFVTTVVQNTMLVDVPGDWGNNASADTALTSYSPVNDSGAISPSAGTLTISYFPAEGEDDQAAFDEYTKNIAGMSVTTALDYEDVTAASLPARKIDFSMSVGANQFSCETVCFAYQDTVYAIELMQGQQTEYDYFPVYHRVVKSAEVGDSETVAAALEQVPEQVPEQTPEQVPEQVPEQTPEQTPEQVPEQTPEQTPEQVPEQTPEQTPEQVPEQVPEQTPEQTPEQVPEQTPEPSSPAEPAGDLGSFQFAINGHTYQFPTLVRQIAPEDLPLQRESTIPYDFMSDADMQGGSWTEIVNTQYYYFENAQYKEIAGVTNMSGYPVSMLDCQLTALIDTGGSYVDVVLPGNVRVGGQESDILRAFPEFNGKPLDGEAGFRGNELLYACNVRDDGCDGYVLIRNDAPYYSAVSIICENGVIKEISFECLGSVRAEGVFL